MKNKIIGMPEIEYDYEFMVVIPMNGGKYKWHSNHETIRAYQVALKVNGVVVHNVRVHGKELRRK